MVKKLKKIPSDLLSDIQIETEAMSGTNAKMMLSSYCLSKLEKDRPQMSAICSAAKKLVDSVKKQEEEIIIEGDLKNAVFRIKEAGNVAWGICAASLDTAIAACLATPTHYGCDIGRRRYASNASCIAMPTVILGTAFVPAFMIGIYAGEIAVLTTLRDKYVITEKGDRFIKLKRKRNRTRI